MTLNHLSHAQVAHIVHGMTDGKTLPQEVLAQIITKTDGVPLFVEEMTKAMLESDQLTAVDGHYALTGAFSTVAIPATLQDSLMARLDRLVTAKAVAQYAAVIGRQFSYELLQVVSQLDAATLQQELGRLVEAEIVYHRGVPPQATYTFKHALIQDAAYESLLKRTRQRYHQRIAQVLAERFPATAETQPELLAHHYTEAGLAEQAIPYWQWAGQCAIARSANLEAISHLTKSLELLTTLPDTPEHRQQELDVQTTLGHVLSDTKGLAAPEVGAAYHRARELCQQVGGPPQLFPVLQGLVFFSINRGEFQTARELGEQLLSLAQHGHDPARLADAHIMLGNALTWLGEWGIARLHLEQGLALYNPQQQRPHVLALAYPGVFGLSRLALVLWELGYPDQALKRSQEALTLARELAHPFSLATALIFAADVHQRRREAHMTYEWAEEALVLSREQGFAFRLAQATVLRGWALVEQGQGEAGIAQIRQGLVAYRATGVATPGYLGLLVEGYKNVGQIEEGLRVIEERRGAGLYRLKGELLLTRSSEHQAEAETCFHQALDATHRRQAKSQELRAARSLARLWQHQGKQAEARALLALIYGWFTEGFDTADLQEAKALLDELGV
jgi:tetratricopeptide (TPR) repeat protein